MSKLCTKCKIEKPLSEYNKNGNGLQSYCKSCAKIYNAERKARNIKARSAPDYEPPTKKQCSICNEIKPVNEFTLNVHSVDGYTSSCKWCTYRSPEAHARRIFNHMNHANKINPSTGKPNRTGFTQQPDFDKNWLVNWLLNNDTYLKLHNEWVKSGFVDELSPSVDRRNADVRRYTKDNLDVMTWEMNNAKSHVEHSTKVHQFDRKGNYIASYESIRVAGAAMNGGEYSISKQVGIGDASNPERSNNHTAYNFKWIRHEHLTLPDNAVEYASFLLAN